MDNYLTSIKLQFEYYKSLGEKTIDQLNEDELYWQPHPESNSIAILINHLSGNMMSRWTDFLISDGEKEWRQRDAEFKIDEKNKEILIFRWEEGWNCLYDALDSINSDNFGSTIYIRNKGHSITEAINRQLSHYAYHVGQMVFLGKMIKGGKWNSLSIPKGKSISFNKKEFSRPKRKEHFTKKFIDKNNRPS